jgi:hypothetical protein
MHRIIFALFFCLLIANSQLISIKTVPLATGNQFLLYPSQTFGMGGVSIALNDTYGDPFNNPVSGRNIRESSIFCLPTFYKSTAYENFNKSLPVTLLYNSTSWFGGCCLTLQQINNQLENVRNQWPENPQKLSSQSRKNHYLHLLVGREVIKNTTHLGISFFLSDLNAIDGIEYLYANSTDVEQEGKIYDYRLGLSHIFKSQQTVELLLLHHRFTMIHRVVYPTWWGWEDLSRDYIFPMDRIEEHKDRTQTWGGHLRYLYPIKQNRWQLGSIVTMNYKTHPKIPNYDLMNIPRDPGDSYAYNVGFGIAKSTDSLKFGIDMIYEPIWSTTWAEAPSAISTSSGKVISPGAKTVNNDFQFYNYHLRTGFSNEGRVFGIQLGMAMSSINYRLKQQDYVLEQRRNVEESWFEWHFTWGMLFKFSGFNLHYQGMLTHGLGRPGIDMERSMRLSSASMQSDIMLAPAGDLTLVETSTITHRFMVVVPLGE